MTSLWSRLNLASRLILSTGIIGLLSVGILSYIAITDQAFFEGEKLVNDFKLDLDSTVTAITEHAITGDYSTIQQILTIRADHEHIQRAAWVDRTGHLLEAKKKPLQKKAPGWFLKWISIPDTEGSKPLDIGGQNYGKVFLSYTSAHAVNMIWQHFLLQLKIAFSGFIAFLIATMLILKYSFRPLYSLANSAKQFGKGNYSVRIPDAGLPELLPSIGAFNDMADKLQTLILSLPEGEAALRQSENRYRMLFQHSPVGIFNYDTQLCITDCNDRFVAILRSSREKLLGFDMKTLKDQSVTPCLLKAADGKEGMYEGLYHATNGTAVIWASLLATPVFDRDGRVTSCIGIVEDVTERKETEMKLQESERKYRKIFENVQDIFYQADLNGNIIEISPSIKRYSGYTREELVGKPILNFYFYPEDRARLLDAMERKGEVIDFEVRLKTKDDRLVYTAANAHFLVDEAGNRIGMEGSLRDITERKGLEEQLIRSQRVEAIGQLAGGIAHDFNNILTSIIGYGSLLQMKLGTDDPLRENVKCILESADKAAQLVYSLLAFSRKQILIPKPENLNEIIQGMEKLLMPILREDIELKITLKGKNLYVIADSGQIEQVLMNLAANARDAMPGGGRLSIRAERTELDDEFVTAHGYGGPGIYALISVTDTGIGMNEKTRKRIFEPFFTTKEVGRGTGLGLAMVYGLIKQHNGYIHVYSELGKGTTFKIYIPAIEAALVAEKKPAVTSHPTEGTETILLAEDDGTLRKLSQTVLHEHGYQVITAENGEEAISKFLENRDNVQLLLFDIVMPKKSGKEAYGEIKKIRPDIKVLFVSGYADIPDQKGILDEGLDFLSKPVSPKVLLERVREVLDK